MADNEQKIQRALIGVDQRGVPVVLATDGEGIACDCDNVCTGAEDIGLLDGRDLPKPGLYLWTGTSKIETHQYGIDVYEPEVVYTGTVRPVKPEEVEELYAMQPPDDGFEDDHD